ncbi:MAG: EutN/CcmL family microcompartment protein [Pseudomonadota bacterium]
MRLCRVLGTVTQTAKHPSYIGQKLMVVQALQTDGGPAGSSFLAVDRVQAGAGDLVLVMSEGNGVRQLFSRDQLPIRSIIIGIVDEVSLSPESRAGTAFS